MKRAELIEAGVQAILIDYEPVAEPDPQLKRDVAIVLDAIEPLIRADERDAVLALHSRLMRAEVESLIEYGCPEWSIEEGDDLGRHLRRDQVLALIDEAGR